MEMNTHPEVLDGKRTINEVSADTLALYEALKDITIDGMITYANLSDLIGRDVQSEAIGSLTTARRMCQMEDQIVFSPVRGVGLKRLDDSGIVEYADNDIAKIHRAARRGVERLGCASYANLSEEQKPSFNAKAAVLGTIATHSRRAHVKQIEKTYANNNPPSLPESLKM